MSEVSSQDLVRYEPPADTMRRLKFAIQAMENGCPALTAIGLAGVHKRDFDWLYNNDPEVQANVKQALAKAVQKHIEAISIAGAPRTIRKKAVTSSYNEKFGQTDTETITEEEIPGDWRAPAWLLERIDKEGFGTTLLPVQAVEGADAISKLISATAKAIADRSATIINKENSIEAEFTEPIEE